MKTTDLIRYSRQLIKGRRFRTLLVCIMPALVSLFFRTAEACIYSLLLYFGEMKPIELFSGSNRIQLAVAVFFTILRYAACAPLIYGAAYRLCEITSEGNVPRRRVSDVILSRRCYKRSLAAQLWVKLFSLAALIPAAFFGITAYSLFTTAHSAGRLFLTAHAMILTAASLVIWLGLRLSLAAVPLFLVKFPNMSVFRIVIGSLRFMSGRRKTPLRLIAAYTPFMLTVAGIPFVLPELLTAFSLSIDIFIKEEEYLEGVGIFGRGRSSSDSARLPAR